jgi:hypothetical protein
MGAEGNTGHRAEWWWRPSGGQGQKPSRDQAPSHAREGSGGAQAQDPTMILAGVASIEVGQDPVGAALVGVGRDPIGKTAELAARIDVRKQGPRGANGSGSLRPDPSRAADGV